MSKTWRKWCGLLSYFTDDYTLHTDTVYKIVLLLHYFSIRNRYKLLGFICFKAPISANYVGHFTVLRPYYFENYWKWFYLD